MQFDRIYVCFKYSLSLKCIAVVGIHMRKPPGSFLGKVHIVQEEEEG